MTCCGWLVLSLALGQHAGRPRRPVRVLRLLAIVEERGPIRIGDLAHADQTSQPAVTRQASRLEELGWVERIGDPADARATLGERHRRRPISPSSATGSRTGRRSPSDEAALPVQRIRETAQLLEKLLQAARRVAGEE